MDCFNEMFDEIGQCCDRLGWDELQRQYWLRAVYGKQSRLLLTDHQLETALAKLRRLLVYHGV